MKKIFTLKRVMALALSLALLMTSMIIPSAITDDDTTASSLSGKTILFTGDSIGAGWRDTAYGGNYTNQGGWAARIADSYGAEATLAAVAGSPLSTIREEEGREAIVNQLHANKDGSFDYVVLQGGFNDAMGTNADRTKESAAPVGEMTDSFDVADFDTATFAGALENLFYYAKEYFPESKVGFIITYATPLSTYGGYTAEEDSMREYWNMAKAICDKWGVSYLDLFDGTTADGQSYSYDILKVDTEEYFPGSGDQIHITAAGYDVITPYIASWLPTTSPMIGGYTVKWENSVPTDALIYLDFETEYAYSEAHAFTNSTVYYDEAYAENWNGNGSANNRGNNSKLVTDTDGNKAVQFTWDDGQSNENYNANGIMNIYDPSTKSTFIGDAGKWYKITFKVKVTKSDNIPLQFYLATSGRTYLTNGSSSTHAAFKTTDCNFSHKNAMKTAADTDLRVYAAGDTFTAPTDGWVTVSANWYADGTHFPVIGVMANNKTTIADLTEYAAVLVDDVTVMEKAAYVDFETDLSSYYGENNVNWSAANGRGSENALVTLDDGNNVARLTWHGDKDNENYNAATALNIYDSYTKAKFVGESSKTYTISFDYLIENTDDVGLQFYLSKCGRTSMTQTDMGPRAMQATYSSTTYEEPSYVAVSDKLTSVSTQWETLSFTFTADGSISAKNTTVTNYPIILLQANDKTTVTGAPLTGAYASVLIDNISVEDVSATGSTDGFDKKGVIPAYNYDGENTVMLEITRSTTFAALDIPQRKGWIFEGFYTNAALTEKAADDALVGNYKAIYVKWSGDGNAVVPMPIEDVLCFSDVKAFANCTVNKNNPLGDISYTLKAQSAQIGASNVSKWGGEYLFSSDTVTVNDDTTKKLVVDNIGLSTPCHSIMLYVELSDFAAAGKDYGLSLGSKGICLPTPKDDGDPSWNWVKAKADGSSVFYYNDKGEWKTSYFSASGAFTGLPSGYKGYIRIDFEQLTGNIDVTTADYTISCIELSPVVFGGESGDLAIGGIIYVPETRTDSPIWKLQNVLDSSAGTYNNLYFDMTSASDAMVVNPYDVYSDSYAFSTRYSGTAAEPAVKLVDKETSAFWATAPVAITTASGMQETTSGYMTTYINPDAAIIIQPGVDSFMFYVELPEFTEGTINAPLKLLDTVLYQTGTTVNLSFSNSAYEYASVYDGIWQSARAGADGDLKDIPSGFKGFIKFCVKDFKNFNHISYYNADGNLTGIDMSKPYSISKFELGFNHIGGENGELVIGGVYSVVVNSEVPFVKNGINGESFCFKAIPGDYDADANFSAEEIVSIRKNLIGNAPEFDAVAKLRAENNDITTLVAATLGMADTSNEGTEPVYPEIFSADIGTTDGAVVYEKVYTDPANYQVIAQDYEAYQEKGDAFAAEVLANQIGTFEKTGIDKMCHVSTFYYSHGNIYMSYYANSISASENPAYQVARLAYAPEDNPENKVIIDIMQVGDDLYGNKITGVYDTILMPKEDEPDNLYILWTAAVNGEYYRLYQVFNMETEELGPIGVNRFKVGNTVNDFSRAGMKKALNNEGIGYKTFASDIGIMQKLSTRVENGETYYYTGAYCCDFTCIIKSKDLITWEYVAQPNEGANGTGFENCTRWENAVYVVGDKVYYYVRQWDPLNVTSNGSTPKSTTNRTENGSYYGILTAYDLITGEWETPILVEDCQSRSDFIMYQGNLYLIYAPTPDSGESDREHLGILKINTEDLSKTEVVLQAKMGHSCFYPFWQYNSDGELCISYTYSREEIRLASITLSNYLD